MVRTRNRRGEGGKLRADSLAGARELVEQAGDPEAVTLRAVARQVGISAPSIYPHFADRAAIMDAIVDDAFADFNGAISAAIEQASGPVAQLRAGCAAYLRFAADRPNRYRLLFMRDPRATGDPARDLVPAVGKELALGPAPAIRTQSFAALVKSLQGCIEAGQSASTDPYLDSAAIWVALHGYATLHVLLPFFPWPDTDALLDRLVYGLARIAA
jgi:AcrR family transcriptional regulator